MLVTVNAIVSVDSKRSPFSFTQEYVSAYEAVQSFRHDIGTDFVSAVAKSEHHGNPEKFDHLRPWLHYFSS